jgi:hypothetical protein
MFRRGRTRGSDAIPEYESGGLSDDLRTSSGGASDKCLELGVERPRFVYVLLIDLGGDCAGCGHR